VTVLEVQGIKCSARSFQIEFEVKQMLQIAPVDMFDKCILLKKNISNIDTIPIPLDDINNRENITLDRDVLKDSGTDDFTNETDIIADDEDSIEKDPSNSPNNESVDDENCEQTVKTESNDQKYLEASSEMPDIRANANIQETNIFSDLTEFDMNLDDIEKSDQIQIRARNDIYYELYKEARKKARISRNLALQSYLEAKEIKTKYDLDDIESDEDDHFFTSALQSEESR